MSRDLRPGALLRRASSLLSYPRLLSDTRRTERAFLRLAVVAAAGVAGGAAFGPALRAARPAGIMHELARSRPQRAFSPRLSVETAYRACTAVAPPDGGTVPRDACREDGGAPAALDGLAAGDASFDPDSLRASALVGALWRDARDPSLDGAVAGLVRALRLSRDSVGLLVDLSGVYLVRAQRTQSPHDLMAGLNYAREARARDPENRAAIFNEALALEWLAVDGEAVRAWDEYLAADGRSLWADEARRRRAALLRHPAPPVAPTSASTPAQVDAFAAAHPQQARLLGMDRVLGEWGAAVLAGRTARADSLLAFAERLGRGVARRGDFGLADEVRAIAAVQQDAEATRRLARAHEAYALGQALWGDYRFHEAERRFAEAARLASASPALRGWTRVFLAGTHVYYKRFPAADSAFSLLFATADSVRHPATVARARWMQGTSQLRRGRYGAARTGYQAAARAFLRLGEGEFAGISLVYDGEAACEQGDVADGYRSMHRAMLSLRPYRHSVHLHNALNDLATCAIRDGMPLAALAIQDEDVTVALRARLLVAPEALMARARVRALTGDAAGAVRDLDAVVPLVKAEHGAVLDDFLARTLPLTRAVVSPGAVSPTALDAAVHYFAETNVVWYLAALFRRADVREAAGDLDGAVADLDRATRRIRTMSERDSGSHFRAAMVEQARSRFDQLAMLHLRAGRPAEALQVLERGRISFSAPLGSLRAQRVPRAPAGHVAVEYALVGDTLLAWTVRDTVVRVTRTRVPRAELQLAVEQAGAALEGGSADRAAEPLRRLHGWLVRPVADRLGGPGTPLVILADGEIAGVPFAALRAGPRGRYLVQDHPLRFAASLADAARPAGAVNAGPALLVGDPAFDPEVHLGLDRLDGARAEADSLRTVYPDAVVLAPSEATFRAFAARAPGASLVHYAGHAVFNDTRPERSFLVLAGGEGLSADAAQSLDLRGVRMVVLSACRTVRAREGRSGGFAGFSGALLAAGAGGVVGSLWEADDRLTQPLMLRFHREFRRAGDPARALRQAQLAMLASRDPALRSPSAWAGFRYVGR